MISLLNEDQKTRYKEFKEFVAFNIEPSADQWDRDEKIPNPRFRCWPNRDT